MGRIVLFISDEQRNRDIVVVFSFFFILLVFDESETFVDGRGATRCGLLTDI